MCKRMRVNLTALIQRSGPLAPPVHLDLDAHHVRGLSLGGLQRGAVIKAAVITDRPLFQQPQAGRGLVLARDPRAGGCGGCQKRRTAKMPLSGTSTCSRRSRWGSRNSSAASCIPDAVPASCARTSGSRIKTGRGGVMKSSDTAQGHAQASVSWLRLGWGSGSGKPVRQWALRERCLEDQGGSCRHIGSCGQSGCAAAMAAIVYSVSVSPPGVAQHAGARGHGLAQGRDQAGVRRPRRRSNATLTDSIDRHVHACTKTRPDGRKSKPGIAPQVRAGQTSLTSRGGLA